MYHLIIIVKIKNIMRVCILGDGLSALTLAKALINQNIFVDMFAKKKAYNINQTRTLGISKYNLDFFNKNIINVEKLIWKIKRIEIFTDNLKDEKLLNFKNDNSQLFSIIRNNELYKILENNLFKNKYFKKIITIKENLSLIKDYELIINCDYDHKITKKHFSKKIIKKYNSLAYTTIVNHEKIYNDTAVQIFTKLGPLAFLPISKNQTSVVYSIQSRNKKNDNIEELIHRYNFKYKINKIEKIENFELKSLNLRSYHHNNILAFGDLLHRVHPLAGQGFNMTIRDIIEITKIIKKKLEFGLPFDKSVCIEFQNNIRHRNLIFSNGINLIHEFFNIERKSKNDLLSKSIKFFGNNSSINKIFTKIADRGIFF